jgi:hypothetical protein
LCQRSSSSEPRDQSDTREHQPLPEHHRDDGPRFRAEGETHAKLAEPLGHVIRNDGVRPDRREDKRETGEDGRERTHQAQRRDGIADPVAHHPRVGDQNVGGCR